MHFIIITVQLSPPYFFHFALPHLVSNLFLPEGRAGTFRNLWSSRFPVSFPCNIKCIISHGTPDFSSSSLAFPLQRNTKWKTDIAHFMCKLLSLDAAECCVLLLFRNRKATIVDLRPESEWPERYFRISTAPPG